jgi:hypothetical protein
MADVVLLEKRRAAPNEGVVDELRRLLAAAERGEVVNLAYAYVERDGSACSCICAGPFASALQGGVAQLAWKYAAQMHQNSERVDLPEPPTG